MPIETFFRSPGDLMDASAETDLQDAIEAETLALGSENIRTEGINRVHFQPQPSDITTSLQTSANLLGSLGVYTSASYVPIVHGTPMLLDFGASGLTIQPGWIVRFQWSLIVIDYERAGNIGEYAFCLKTDTGGAGTFVQQSPDYWYSAMSYPRDGPSTATYWPMINRRHTMSYTMTATSSYTLYQARVDVKIADPWSLTIRHDNLFSIVQRH